MLTEKDYCDYNTCVALKELGFREKCLTYYDTNDNVGLLYNTQWTLDNIPYQFTDCLESHNAYKDNSYVDAPTVWEVQKWLREKKEVYISVIPEYNEYCPVKGVVYRLEIAHWKDDESRYETIEWLDEEESRIIHCFESYEQAISEGIKAAINILK